jgi:hypothetical protein
MSSREAEIHGENGQIFGKYFHMSTIRKLHEKGDPECREEEEDQQFESQVEIHY